MGEAISVVKRKKTMGEWTERFDSEHTQNIVIIL
jgi:hypothetical protein